MKRTPYLAVLVALLTGYAYASSLQAVAAYTFTCNGNQNQRSGPCPKGGRPESLILGSDGKFYGAAQVSMEGDSAPNGGTVFSLASARVKVLHTFVPGPDKNYADGNLPGLLTEGPDGKLYGETVYGGNDGCNGYCGYGVLYRVNRDGSGFRVIHKFCSETNCADGVDGYALVAGADGNVYGTTMGGGSNTCEGYPCGTLFRVTPSTGKYEVVVNFDETTGGIPSGLIVAADQTFLGDDRDRKSRSDAIPLHGSYRRVAVGSDEFSQGQWPDPAGKAIDDRPARKLLWSLRDLRRLRRGTL